TYFFNLLYFRSQQATVPGVRNYYAHVEDSYRGIAWNRMFAKLIELRNTCREANIDFRVVVFPFLHNLGPDYPFRDAHERIVEACRREDVPCLDLLPVLEPHARERLVVNMFDAHPNERAHELAAFAIEHDLLNDLVEKAKQPQDAPAENR
ncbi:MAG: SGNH/GDSL hydrolase family protein, partial [Planctomycetota bacterium]|nr:SGNH/GDSL hydrolase family protein [Planctomycetota bacterium]